MFDNIKKLYSFLMLMKFYIVIFGYDLSSVLKRRNINTRKAQAYHLGYNLVRRKVNKFVKLNFNLPFLFLSCVIV